MITTLTMTIRICIVSTCYGLSSLGFAMMFQLMREELNKPDGAILMIVIWSFAWIAHAVMSFAWVIDKKLDKFWPIAGALAGIASFLVWPILAFESSFFGRLNFAQTISATLMSAAFFMVIQFLVLLPCILLAIKLEKFHRENLA
jgi:branched-subunit amino acid ABC-type transport system permease component